MQGAVQRRYTEKRVFFFYFLITLFLFLLGFLFSSYPLRYVPLIFRPSGSKASTRSSPMRLGHNSFDKSLLGSCLNYAFLVPLILLHRDDRG